MSATSLQVYLAIKKVLQGQGCHGQGKVRENQKFFKVREKSGNFAKGQGKSQFLSKSVKSQGILFSGFVKFMKTFSFGKKEVVVDRVMRSNAGFFGQWLSL